jgi:adenine phosphoribosyltransferase
LIVDDLIATGGTARATADLIEEVGGHVGLCLFLIELGFLPGRERLDGFEVASIVTYD